MSKNTNNITATLDSTNTERRVIYVPPTKSLHPEHDGVKPRDGKIRVAAYCRVSTTLEEQQGSYNLQETYYEAMIKKNPDWEFAGIYGDEGKSGTSLKGRTGFLSMMDDVRAGKIDYIITKATSRFGRNVHDFIEILDELESYGVEVLFESEGIVTSGRQDRTMLQIIGATNEHYSSSLSDNIRWSKERNMQQGKVTISYKTFLGYRKGEDGKPEIVEEEAKVVRQIYALYLEGKSYSYIARFLIAEGIPTPGGKRGWTATRIRSILTNEKYTGDVILQKTFTRNYLDKKSRINDGEKAKVIVENNHDAIIDKATFARVQELIKKRASRKDAGTDTSPFVGRVICGDCGDYFVHKTWNSRGRIKYAMWVCNSKYTELTAYTDKKCQVANIREEWLEQGYLYAVRQLLARKEQIRGRYTHKLSQIDARLDSGEIENELVALDVMANKARADYAALKGEWEFTFGDDNTYDKKLLALTKKTNDIQSKINKLEEEKMSLASEKSKIRTFLETLNSMPENPIRFNGKYFINTIDRVEVGKTDITFHFYGGESIKVTIEQLKKMWY